MLSRELREFAESPDRYTRLSEDVERFADERVCVVQGATWAAVSGVRVAADEVARLLAEVRALVPPEKRATWWLGPSTEPADLADRLLALGLGEPADGHELLYALACAAEPPRGPEEVEVRRVETLDEYELSYRLMWEAFETPEERREQQRRHLAQEFEAVRRAGVPGTFVASVEGRPAGLGRSIYSERGVFLIAGAVLPWARRRGVYRALVRARWDDAVARGTPALVVEALPDTSYPILKRLGFADVCRVRRLEDPRR